MKIAITGGCGFVGGRLAGRLAADGHEVVVVTRPGGSRSPWAAATHAIGLADQGALAAAFHGCEVVVHCAGINREIGSQTFQAVHVQGTRNVAAAAQAAGARKIVFLSFLRARPDCGSGYHESKWAAEEIIRGCGLDYTVLKPGVIYGKGDHMLDHLSHAFHTLPVFALVGLQDQLIRPMAVEDMVRILCATVVGGNLPRQTVAITGPEELTLRAAVARVASVVGRRPLMFRLPVWFHYAMAWVLEKVMRTPLVALAQVRILSEGVVEPAPPCAVIPKELAPAALFTEAQIRLGLPEPKPFGLGDLRFCPCHE